MIVVCLFIALFSLAFGQFACPQTSWTTYKNSYLLIQSTKTQNFFARFYRNIDYNCVEENFSALKTSYYYNIYWRTDTYMCEVPGKIECSGRCRSKTVTTRLKCDRWSSDIGSNKQRIKNCDFLFWTTWSSTVNCSLSNSISYTRSCVDCDYDVVGSQYCDGNATKTEECPPSWSTTSGGSSSNAIIGLGVAIALAISVIIGLCIFIYVKRYLQTDSKTAVNEACDPSNKSTISSPKLTSLPGSSAEEIYSNAQDHTTADATYSTLHHK